MSITASRLAPELRIVGDVSGQTDLVIEGVLEGNVTLPGNAVRVAASGTLRGDVEAREVHVDGAVRGNLKAEVKVAIGPSARIEGHVASPRVQLEDGGQLDGSVTMVTKKAEAPAPAPARASAGAEVVSAQAVLQPVAAG